MAVPVGAGHVHQVPASASAARSTTSSSWARPSTGRWSWSSVIGARAERVAEADGWAHIAGLTVGQDISDRTLQFAAGAQFSLGKSRRRLRPDGAVARHRRRGPRPRRPRPRVLGGRRDGAGRPHERPRLQRAAARRRAVGRPARSGAARGARPAAGCSRTRSSTGAPRRGPGSRDRSRARWSGRRVWSPSPSPGRRRAPAGKDPPLFRARADRPTGTTTSRSSSLRDPASISSIARPPATNRPISSSGRWVALRPMR